MSREQFSWILNQEPWTQLEQVLLDNSLDQITLSLGKLVLVIIGLRDTTPKEQNSLTRFLMWLERKQKAVIASKDSKSPIHSVEALDQAWEHF